MVMMINGHLSNHTLRFPGNKSAKNKLIVTETVVFLQETLADTGFFRL